MSAPWLTRQSVAEMAKIKSEHPDGIDVFTAMGIAAHKQFEDVELLLQLVESDKSEMEEDALARVLKIEKRHEAYREALKGRTDSIFP